MDERPSVDETWMNVAYAVSQRATCPRAQVGAVLVDHDGYIVSTGYNGSPRGMPHCDTLSSGHVENGHCVCAVHAELNALLQAGRSGRSTVGSTLYTTASPCRGCMSAAINAGVKRVVYFKEYRVDDTSGAWALEAAKIVDIEMCQLRFV